MEVASLALTAFSLISNMSGAKQSADASQAQANYQAQVARNNQIVSEQNAQYALQVGQTQEAAKREQMAQTNSKVRAAVGASGVDPNFGSAVRLQKAVATTGEEDALTIRNNAARQAYGFRVQGTDYAASAQLDAARPGEQIPLPAAALRRPQVDHRRPGRHRPRSRRPSSGQRRRRPAKGDHRMNLAEAAAVLAKAAAFDRRTVGEADILAWHEVLADIEFADALVAVAKHYAENTDRIMPAHVRRLAIEIDRGRRKAMREAYEREAQLAIEADPTRRDRSDVVREVIAKLRDSLHDGDPDKLRRAEWIEIDRRRGRTEEPNPNFVAPPPPGGHPIEAPDADPT